MGPVIWRGTHGETELVFRLVPLAGLTRVTEWRSQGEDEKPADSATPHHFSRQGGVLLGGVMATLVFGAAIAGVVALWEFVRRRRWTWGRMIVADAVVLTVFNFLPVPPLDGGRAVLAAVTAWRGAPLSGDALFWLQLGGLAIAVVPMMIWTRWTGSIDRAAMTWGAPARADKLSR